MIHRIKADVAFAIGYVSLREDTLRSRRSFSKWRSTSESFRWKAVCSGHVLARVIYLGRGERGRCGGLTCHDLESFIQRELNSDVEDA